MRNIASRVLFYWTDDGNLAGLRFDQYKVVFMEQQAHGRQTNGTSRDGCT